MLEHAFVGLAPDEHGLTQESWPATLDRRVGMVVDQLWTGLQVCASGELLAVLPDVVASSELYRDRLHRLPVDLVPPTELFALHRSTIAESGRAEAVTHAMRLELAAQ